MSGLCTGRRLRASVESHDQVEACYVHRAQGAATLRLAAVLPRFGGLFYGRGEDLLASGENVPAGVGSVGQVLDVGLAVNAIFQLGLGGRVAHDRCGGVLVAVGGVLDQFLLGELEAL